MIGFLRGNVALRHDPYLYLDVSGVGYKVLVTHELLMTPLNSELTIYTYTYVREDALELFGFSHQDDLILFEKLISISGIGPKTAVQIFSVGSKSEILQAIASGDIAFFLGVPRLGKKNAQKIIIELRNKIDDTTQSLLGGTHDELFDALTGMGFTVKEIQSAVQNLDLTDVTTEQKIKKVLKQLQR